MDALIDLGVAWPKDHVVPFAGPGSLTVVLCGSIQLGSGMGFPTMWLCDQQSLRSACAYARSDHSLCQLLAYSMRLSYCLNIIWSF